MKKLILLVMVFALINPTLRAEDILPEYNYSVDESQTTFVIRGFDFDISGRTRSFAIIQNGEFSEGERIQGREGLERYITDKTQLLMNQRVLDYVAIGYSLGEAEEDGALPVNLHIHTKDTWNFIILPYPQYDSNDGLQLSLKIRNYNFFGTMSPLSIDIGYQYDTDSRHSFNFLLESNTPFEAAGLIWYFRFDHELIYTIDEPLFYKNITGLSVELPTGRVLTTLGINEYLFINESNNDHDMDKYNLEDDRFGGPYAASEAFASFKIPLMTVSNYGDLSYTPRISGKISYTKGGVDEPRRPVGILSHSLGFGRVNWTGNFRHGLEASLENSNNFYALSYDWFSEINANIAFHHNFNKFFGFSTNLQYRQRLNDILYEAGDVLRGITNRRIRSEYMLSLNTDFPFRILRFYPSELFNNSKLRFFDFELHTSPFLDFALVEGLQKESASREVPYEGARFGFEDAFCSAGMEVIVFPAFMRSLYIRFSVGYDLRKAIKNKSLPKWDEIFIGTGHHF